MAYKNSDKEAENSVKLTPHHEENKVIKTKKKTKKKRKEIVYARDKKRSPLKTGAIMNAMASALFGFLFAYVSLHDIVYSGRSSYAKFSAKGLSGMGEIILTAITIALCVAALVIAVMILKDKYKDKKHIERMLVLSIVATVLYMLIPCYIELTKYGAFSVCQLTTSVLPIVGIIGSVVSLAGVRNEKNTKDLL